MTFNTLLVYSMPDEAKRAAIDDIARWAATGDAVVNIAERYALKEIIRAHEMVESGTKIGQVLLTIPHRCDHHHGHHSICKQAPIKH